MAQTKVILREKIESLGAEADVVTVRAGYARNFLIPEGKAYEATKGNLRHLESLKVARVRREAEELANAQKLAKKISKFKPVFTLELGDSGKAFGSVTSIDIHKKLEEGGIEIQRHCIELKKPIKTSGKSDVTIKLHSEVSATLVVTVAAETESAE
jgi:large subunit ribosomal protein L9